MVHLAYIYVLETIKMLMQLVCLSLCFLLQEICSGTVTGGAILEIF